MNTSVICWFEIYTEDIERAKKFYSSVLGVEFYHMPAIDDDVIMAAFSSPENMQDVSGALVQVKGASVNTKSCPSTIVYFPCINCSEEEGRVEKAGGKIVTSKMSIGEHGFCSICTDSEINTFGLHSME